MSFKKHDEAMCLFLNQHSQLHSAKITNNTIWSFEDEIFRDLSGDHFRRIPRNREHSIAWCIWHLARIEDTAMNILVAGRAQVLSQDNWIERMKIAARDTGNAMDQDGVAKISEKIDIDALRAYRLAVGRRTRQIVGRLQPEQLKERVAPNRLQQVMDQGALVEAARGIADYWGRRNIAGLLLMPATRHNIIHLNEALMLKNRK